MFNKEDLKEIEARGASLAKVQDEIDHFKTGFPWMTIVAAATPDKGIKVLDETQAAEAVAYYEGAKVAGKCKFVPASGAASRMFKDIFSGLAKLNAGEDVPEGSPVSKLAAQIEKFAFYTPELFGTPEDSQAYRRDVAAKLLTDEGLGYGSKPKGVLKFHRYESGECRTAFAEHLIEAKEYMRNADGSANVVFTVSPEHLDLFKAVLAEVKDGYEAKFGVKYNISFTFQDKATDTIAVDNDNEPFRTDDGKLLFRPAGHGALIHNLNKLDEELVSIKNIDNVAQERLLPITAKYKKALMGKALELRDKIFALLAKLDAVEDPAASTALLDEAEAFLADELCVALPESACPKCRLALLKAKLNRPIRVCGMVKNEGEPGGGPFIVKGKDGSTNLQILEGPQINKADAVAAAALAGATHFNPVDLVCVLRDYKGEKFDLTKYVDPDAGFISSKSFQGRELKAMELPGLWNGAMSDWNTLFVEVPLESFNPVKVVLDLLRPNHQ